MIILKNISYTTNSNEKILDDINLNIKKGEFVVITGKSGSGKTTLQQKDIFSHSLSSKTEVDAFAYELNGGLLFFGMILH